MTHDGVGARRIYQVSGEEHAGGRAPILLTIFQVAVPAAALERDRRRLIDPGFWNMALPSTGRGWARYARPARAPANTAATRSETAIKILFIYLPVSFRKAMMAARSTALLRRNDMSLSGITVSGSVNHLSRSASVQTTADFFTASE